MTKKHTNLSLDGELVEKAKEKGWSMSEIAEEALRAKLEIKEVEIDTSIGNCEFCDSLPMRKATAKNLNGLNWLYPDEKWICTKCLKAKSLKETYG